MRCNCLLKLTVVCTLVGNYVENHRLYCGLFDFLVYLSAAFVTLHFAGRRVPAATHHLLERVAALSPAALAGSSIDFGVPVLTASSTILIRNCYKTFFDKLLRPILGSSSSTSSANAGLNSIAPSARSGMVISGSPGIGKSIFGLLLIPLLQHIGRPVVYHNEFHGLPALFIKDSQVQWDFDVYASIDTLPIDTVFVRDPAWNSNLVCNPAFYTIFCCSPRAERSADVHKVASFR